MWRKRKPNYFMVVAPDMWSQEEITNTNVTDKNTVKRVSTLVNVSCSDISTKQLNPNLVNPTSIIANGVPIEAINTDGMWNPTDKADIDELVNNFAEQAEKKIKK